jgi:hypothetical protein
MVLETSVDSQSYTEDCEVCCRPIEVSYTVDGAKIRNFEANPV